MRDKRRADVLLVERGLAPTRTRAQALLLAGQVYAGEQRIDKVGTLLDASTELTVRESERFVSRGGYKLEGALDALNFDVTQHICADVGASTGGFTDCLLQRGARKVYAIDVGHGQLAAKLRSDPRVIVMERTNARYLTTEQFGDPITLVVVDASFISLDKLLPAIGKFLAPDGKLLALVKPQFEVGKEEARRNKGVVRDPIVREAAIERIRLSVVALGFEIVAGCDSCLPGPKGNLEYFLSAVRR
jgi:23S rRNA (cytidine1920-2'-O)/16S rRNA (cytidine1409-2'-O)-methyltransferase